jgi:tellurite resistance protein TehA-like permease
MSATVVTANPNGSQKAMETVLRSLSVLALLAVVGVLLAGLWNMLRGRNPNLSQTLMRWRVGLQFLAIVVAMLLVYLLR